MSSQARAHETSVDFVLIPRKYSAASGQRRRGRLWRKLKPLLRHRADLGGFDPFDPFHPFGVAEKTIPEKLSPSVEN